MAALVALLTALAGAGAVHAIDVPVAVDGHYDAAVEGAMSGLRIAGQDGRPLDVEHPLVFAVVDAPDHGMLSVPSVDCGNEGGVRRCYANLIYTADAGFVGTDTFRFTWANTTATSEPGTFTIDVVEDTDPPVGTLEILVPGADEGTSNALDVFLRVYASDALSPVTRVRVANTAAMAAGLLANASELDAPGSTAIAWDLASFGGTGADGPHVVRVQWQDAKGNWSGVTSATVTVDTSRPTIAGLKPGLRRGPIRYPGRIGVGVRWSGSDRGTGVRSYQVERSVNGGPFEEFREGLVTADVRTWAIGPTYRLRARSVDRAGNVSPWLVTAPMTLRRYRATSRAIEYRGAWTMITFVPDGYPMKSSWTPGSTARIVLQGRSFAWIAAVGPDEGRGSVTVDGRTVATPRLTDKRFAAARAVAAVAWAKKGRHAVTIRVLDGRVTVRELIVLE